jgi:hypothetical protein
MSLLKFGVIAPARCRDNLPKNSGWPRTLGRRVWLWTVYMEDKSGVQALAYMWRKSKAYDLASALRWAQDWQR